jgi:hypothetical protein
MRFARALGSALAFVLALGGCSTAQGPGQDRCLDLLPEYRIAMDEALVCDPTQVDVCAAGRPMLVFSDSAQEYVALCTTPCLEAVNPAHTSKLDEILARFEARGCQLRYCPCPLPDTMPPLCSGSGATGTCTGFGPAPVHLPPAGW